MSEESEPETTPTPEGPFRLPAETLEEAVAKAHAILAYWRAQGGYKALRDDVDACFSVAGHPGGTQWGVGKKWQLLLAAVRGQPLPL